jgi:hypothetical protein
MAMGRRLYHLTKAPKLSRNGSVGKPGVCGQRGARLCCLRSPAVRDLLHQGPSSTGDSRSCNLATYSFLLFANFVEPRPARRSALSAPIEAVNTGKRKPGMSARSGEEGREPRV